MQRFLRRKDVEQITGLPTSTLYDQMDRGDFPRPIKITANRVAWLELTSSTGSKRALRQPVARPRNDRPYPS